MSDVRLVATNPEDSSVVPVACNTNGELVVEKPVITEIDNDVDFHGDVLIDGALTVTGESSLGQSTFDGNASFLNGTVSFANSAFTISSSGHAETSGDYQAGGNPDNGAQIGIRCLASGTMLAANSSSGAIWAGFTQGSGATTSVILADGTAQFKGNVTIGSNGSTWMIVESNGVAHLVNQGSKLSEAKNTEIPQLRDLPAELTMIEQQLQRVMDAMQMTPLEGWIVLDNPSD